MPENKVFGQAGGEKGERSGVYCLLGRVYRPEEKNDILRQYNDKFTILPEAISK